MDRKGDKIKAPGVPLLYDTPKQNVLLAFCSIACLSILQEFVYYHSLWSQIHSPVELDSSNPKGQLSKVIFTNRCDVILELLVG